MKETDAVATAANRAAVFALMAELAAGGLLPRERAGRVLDAMFDTVLQSTLSPEASTALIELMRSDWTAMGSRT